MERPVIAIVGCGFIGSHLAEELPKLFYSQDLYPYHFKFIDFDTWEDRNSANQNVSYDIAVSGQEKAVTCASYGEGYPNNDCFAVVEKVTPQNAKDILKNSVLVIDCVDNIPTRQLLWALAKGGATGPCMHVGISRKGDGIINWSAPNFDTFPFDPLSVAGRDLAEQDYKEPPCEMYKYRAAGHVLFQAVAKAVAIFFGKDPWDLVGIGNTFEEGHMTVWTTSVEDGASLKVDDYLLDEKNEFFPKYWKELDLETENYEVD